jgi:hypothetical protein
VQGNLSTMLWSLGGLQTRAPGRNWPPTSSLCRYPRCPLALTASASHTTIISIGYYSHVAALASCQAQRTLSEHPWTILRIVADIDQSQKCCERNCGLIPAHLGTTAEATSSSVIPQGNRKKMHDPPNPSFNHSDCEAVESRLWRGQIVPTRLSEIKRD